MTTNITVSVAPVSKQLQQKRLITLSMLIRQSASLPEAS